MINVNDLLAVLGDYGKRTDISKTDSNADGVINVSDLLTLLANYGATCDAGAHAHPSSHLRAAPPCPPRARAPWVHALTQHPVPAQWATTTWTSACPNSRAACG